MNQSNIDTEPNEKKRFKRVHSLLNFFQNLSHRNAMPRAPSTNAVAVVDGDKPQKPDTHAVTSGISEAHSENEIVQGLEMLSEASLEESQHLPDMQAEGCPEERSPQPRVSQETRQVRPNPEVHLDQSKKTGEFLGLSFTTLGVLSTAHPATYDTNTLSGLCNMFAEGSPHSSIPRSAEKVLNDQEAPHDRYEKSRPTLLPLGTFIDKSYDSGGSLDTTSHSWFPHNAILSKPSVTEFPMQNGIFQGTHQKVDIGGNARLVSIAGNGVINHCHDGTHGLEKMESFVSFSAQFDSSAQDPERVCHPGTRQNVLKRMQDWIDDPSSAERIFWLHGPAGAGKSAIAQTIANSCGQPKVVATFFFFKSDPSRNDGNKLFTTLAYQLAFSIPAIKDYIAESLHKRPDLPTKSIETQFNDLIALPFQSLVKAASQQSSPANIIGGVNEFQRLAPVIIIDGIDECTDETLPKRFLKIIGNAVKDPFIPLRFLICSRPEALIEDTLNQFKALILPIDLAKLSDSNNDIEKYLVDQFSCIASNRGLDQRWPGEEVIKNILYKSSGNFIFASVFIKAVSDEDNIPETQLANVLNLKPSGLSPFAVLDELYLEILRRQPDQDFLMTLLALLVDGTSLLGYNLYQDDANLMNVSAREMYTKLRRMRSLLKFEPHIDVHHQSFLDFLNEPSRSGDYHVSKLEAEKRTIKSMVNSIVQHVSGLIENPDYHMTHHLSFIYGDCMKKYPLLRCELSMNEMRSILQPLAPIQDKILEIPDSRVGNGLITCDKCNVFYMIRYFLLQLAFHRCIEATNNEVEELIINRERSSVMPPMATEVMDDVFGSDLDSSLSSLLAHLRQTKLESSPSMAIINHTYSVLRFDCAETAMKVRSMFDAQRLVDLLVYLIDEKCILSKYSPDGMSKAAQLVLDIFDKIPILPRSLLLNVPRITPKQTPVEWYGITQFRVVLALRVLNKNYINPKMHFQGCSSAVAYSNERISFDELDGLDGLTSSPTTVIQHMLQTAKTIRHFNAMGISLSTAENIIAYFDLNSYEILRYHAHLSMTINYFMRFSGEGSPEEGNVFAIGCLFYRLYFKISIDYTRPIEEVRRIVAKRPSSPNISGCAWQLIQRCCSEDPSNRPTFDEIAKEIEIWRID